MSDSNQVIDIYRRILVGEDIDYINDAFTADAIVHDFSSGDTTGPKDMIVLAQALVSKVVYGDLDLVRGLKEDDWHTVVMRVKGRGRHHHRPVDVLGTVTVKLRDGQICEAFHHIDVVKMFQQLDLMPPDAMLQCLAGYRLDVVGQARRPSDL